MRSGFAILILTAGLLPFGTGAADARSKVDPDFILLGCLHDNGVRKDIEFARKNGPHKTWETIEFTDYRLSPVMRVSSKQKEGVAACFAEEMAKHR